MPHLPHYQLNFKHALPAHISEELGLLSMVRLLFDILIKLTIFFVPLYIFQTASTMAWRAEWQLTPFQQGMIAVALYYGLARLVVALVSFPLGKLMARSRTRFWLTLALGMQVGELLALYYSTWYWWCWPLLIVMNGIRIPMFWNTYYTLFSRLSQWKYLGEELSMSQVLVMLGTASVPAIAGFIISLFGFKILFLVGTIVAVSTMIVVGLLPDYHKLAPPTLAGLKKWWQKWGLTQTTISYAGRYLNDGTLIIWPIFVLSIVGTLERVGYVYALSLWLAAILSITAGVYIDHQKSRRPYFFSGGLLAGIWLAKSMVSSMWNVLIIDSLDKLTASFHWLVFDTCDLKHSKGNQDFTYFVYRELMISVVAVAFWILVVGAFFLPFSWQLLFVAAAIGSLLSLWMTERRNKV